MPSMKVTAAQCCVMTPVTYAEYLGVPDDAPRTPEEYVVNYVDLEAINRCKVSTANSYGPIGVGQFLPL